ncbi:ImmA/IrrE family metallo-endopeptidase [Micrococcales bacterium 31B]|nr:ImmA/IrrE family metallo-endopeptidase [Micrococcales bacterium 31B]
MPKLAYEAAREYAQQCLDEYWDGVLPVKLSGITLGLGASKYEEDLEALSGLVTKKENEGPVIVLNSREPVERRRFTWAHEIGHIVERRLVARDGDYSFSDARGKKYDLHEFFADEFAGALLIPQDELSSLQASGHTVGAMARTFGVSVKALKRRIARLERNPK